MRKPVQVLMAIGLALMIAGVPLLYQRYRLTTVKRLREVEPGKFYRSGQMTAVGLADTIMRLKIRTVVNVQDEFPDPALRHGFLDWHSDSEREICERLGVRYVWISPDLISRRNVPADHPRAIDEFLALMDDPASYPVLLHCKAGVNRTGCLAAVYRMEYQGWTRAEAFDEMKSLGFGDAACTAANDYVEQYVLTYNRRPR